MSQTQTTYKIIFYHHDEIYEIYARHVFPSDMYGFVEAEELLFGEKSNVLVDPGEEKLKNAFVGVKRTYIPINHVIRIDEVERQGVSKVYPGEGGSVARFPGGGPTNGSSSS